MICPRCKQRIIGYPATSRKDNKTLICSDCGVLEAMEDYLGEKYTGVQYWKGEELTRYNILDASKNRVGRIKRKRRKY